MKPPMLFYIICAQKLHVCEKKMKPGNTDIAFVSWIYLSHNAARWSVSHTLGGWETLEDLRAYQHMHEWPTCMMTSRTRAGVKFQRRAVENVWEFCSPPDKHRYNLWSTVAVRFLFACIDHSRMFYHLNSFYALQTLRNVSGSMQCYARHSRVPIIIVTTRLKLESASVTTWIDPVEGAEHAALSTYTCTHMI